MTYILPFATPPQMGVMWSLPTIAESGSEVAAGNYGPFAFGGINGSASADLTSGEVRMTGSCGLCNSTWKVQWRGFSPITLPLNASINSIYAVAEAKEWDTTGVFNGSFSVSGAPNNPPDWHSSAVGQQSLTVLSANTDEPPEFTTIFTPLSLGSAETDVINAYIVAGFFQTLSLSGNGALQIKNPRLAIYYNAPLMPIGHGANCNAYDPIVLEAGSTSAPGNGILIS